ncbi:MAG: prephenate dehydrogenase/arogenate dehydrogenase family protein [Thermoplasmata archaeon]
MHRAEGRSRSGIRRGYGAAGFDAHRGANLSENEIDDLRGKIAEIDAELLQLIAERLAVARRIGLHKHAHGLEVRRPDMEKRVLERAEKLAEDLGLPRELVHQLFSALITASVDEQIRYIERLAAKSKAGRCLIYGGAGGMGKLLCELLFAEGYDIDIVRSSGIAFSFPKHENRKLDMTAYDFAIVSVPMSKTGILIERAAEDFSGKTIYEICSMKQHLKESISKAEKKGARVVSLHPMFGPSIRSFKDKAVVFCGNKSDFEGDPLWKAFENHGSRIVTVPFEKHDRLMSYVLQLTHTVNIIYFTVLSNAEFAYPDIEAAASPICGRQISNAKAVASQDPNLYFEIQKLSRHLGNLYEEIGVAQAELIEALASDTSGKFRNLMEKGRKCLERR